AEIVQEVGRILHYPRIQQRYNLPEERIQTFLGNLRKVDMVEPSHPLEVVTSDPDDNRYIECAYFGEADYLISGDKHLLAVQQYERTIILRPVSFLAILQTEV
ncbi:MAG: putative toxin-antitoxin system toxin component, PIN family, partial [Ardenticatenaceae bacterium]